MTTECVRIREPFVRSISALSHIIDVDVDTNVVDQLLLFACRPSSPAVNGDIRASSNDCKAKLCAVLNETKKQPWTTMLNTSEIVKGTMTRTTMVMAMETKEPITTRNATNDAFSEACAKMGGFDVNNPHWVKHMDTRQHLKDCTQLLQMFESMIESKKTTSRDLFGTLLGAIHAHSPALSRHLCVDANLKEEYTRTVRVDGYGSYGSVGVGYTEMKQKTYRNKGGICHMVASHNRVDLLPLIPHIEVSEL